MSYEKTELLEDNLFEGDIFAHGWSLFADERSKVEGYRNHFFGDSTTTITEIVDPQPPATNMHKDSEKNAKEDYNLVEIYLSPVSTAQSESGKNLLRRLKGWPKKPQRLNRDLWGLFIDVFRLLISVGFLAFGVAADRISEREVDPTSKIRYIKEMSLLLPTVFPIAFTALTGKTLRDIALALSVRGTRLLNIEQLLQYNSVGGAIVTFFRFRSINILALTLLVVWVFSPLGGQGGLRMIETYNSTTTYQDGSYAYYVLPNASTIQSDRAFNKVYKSDIEFYGAVIDNLFTPSLVSSLGPHGERLERDNFGNVRVPRLSSLKDDPDANGWIKLKDSTDRSSISDHSSSFQYSSFLGIPIRIMGSTEQTSFQIETSYLEFHCFDKRQLDTDSKVQSIGLGAAGKPVQTLFNMRAAPNQTVYIPALTGLGGATSERKEPLYVQIQSHTLNHGKGITQFTCSVIEPKVEVSFRCNSDGIFGYSQHERSDEDDHEVCEAIAMRSSQREDSHPSRGPYSTFLDNKDGLGEFLFDNFPLAGRCAFKDFNISNVFDYLLPELYLYDPSNISGWSHDPSSYTALLKRGEIDLFTVSLDDFSNRLTTIFNSFYQSMQSPYVRASGIPRNVVELRKYQPAPNEKIPASKARQLLETEPDSLGTVRVTISQTKELYRTRRSWFAWYMISSLVLFVSVLISCVVFLLFNGTVAAPDVLGYFSSFTRDNPYIPLSEEETGGLLGTTMDGPTRAVLLKNLRVRLGDIRSRDPEAGHITLFREDIFGQGVPRLGTRPKRRYI